MAAILGLYSFCQVIFSITTTETEVQPRWSLETRTPSIKNY